MSGYKRMRIMHDSVDFRDASLSVIPPEAESPTLPVANIQNGIRQKPFKSAGTGRFTIRVDMKSTVFANSLAIVSHTLAPGATVTVTNYSDEWNTVVHSQEFPAWEPMMLFGEGIFGEGLFGGYPSEDQIALLPKVTRVLFWDDAGYEACYSRYWDVTIDNGGDTSENEVSIGHLFFSNFFEPERNLSLGWKIRPVDSSTVKRSKAGIKWTLEGDRYFVASCDLKRLSKTEAFGEFVRLIHRMGISRDMVLCLFPDDELLKPFTSLYGRFTQVPWINGNQNTPYYFGTQIEFEESL